MKSQKTSTLLKKNKKPISNSIILKEYQGRGPQEGIIRKIRSSRKERYWELTDYNDVINTLKCSRYPVQISFV